jgi:hypothetical protein
MKDQFLKDFTKDGIANVSNSLSEETNEHFWIYDPDPKIEPSGPCRIIIHPTDNQKTSSIEIKNPNSKTIHLFQIDLGLIRGENKRCDFVIFDDENKIIFCELKMGHESNHELPKKTLLGAELQLFATLIFFRQRTDLKECKREFVIGMPELKTKSPTARQQYQNEFLEIHKMKLTIGHSIIF